MKKLIFPVVLVLSISLAYAANCGGAVACNCGDTLTSDHTMWYDLTGCGGNAINFGGTDIALNCNGHSISGTPGGYGINIPANNNYGLITNCHISNFSEGIHIGAWYFNVINNDIQDSNIAISISHSNYNTIIDNLIHNSMTGLNLYDSKYNEIHDNHINGHTEGVHFQTLSGENTFSNNYFNNNVVQVNPGGNGNSWDYNSVGNYWDDFIDNSGYPDYYEINPSNIDHYPLNNYCGQVVTEDIILIEDVLSCPGHGLVVGADGVEIDCAGRMISGTAASGYAGIYVEGFDDVKLKDCEIVNFYHGIKLRDSQYSVITSNDIHDTSIGVTVSYYSRDNLVHGNSLYNNNDDGLYLDNNCNRNNLTNNTISHNSDVGIYLVTNCQNNRISDNDIHSNLDDGIEFNGGSNYNVIYGNRIHDHIDDGFWIQGNSRYNTFFDNILYANGDNAYEDSTSNSNSWNSTIGNDWDDFASNPGYPYTYEIAGPGDGVDYHPVGADEVPQCGSTITTDTTLTEDLLDCPGHGLIIGTDNITLDCMGHWIMGEGFNMHGIRIEADHTTVRNCNVEFFRGIVVHGQHNLIEGNYVQNADGAMFTNPGYDHNTFRDNEATGSYYGINLDSNYNIMTGNILHGNDPYDLHVSPIDATGNLIYGNDFGPNVHEAESGNMWNLSTVGNLWSDFESNPGYPTHYEVPGPGNGVDWHPLNYVPDQFIDLYLTCDDIFLSEDDVLINTTVTITALIHNDLQDNPESFVVRFYSG
ncbi:MAG: right-handed parallel beta-helix repeat-containing protein, partial [Nanoarchaeota archaeon]|nr:right-handed parallel beta-helix repeat-containing protein [Nanoarchaeota archaeon]